MLVAAAVVVSGKTRILDSDLAAQGPMLSVRSGDSLVAIVRANAPRTHWSAPGPVAGLVQWQSLQPGLDYAELELAAGTYRVPVRLILARIDPGRFRFRLALGLQANGMTGTWTLDDAPANAALAVNAGQFSSTGPWGWLVREGHELGYPAHGPLAAAITIDTAGGLSWLKDAEIEQARDRGPPWEAFQSYPIALWGDGEIPAAFRAAHPAMDIGHRDARLVLGEMRDGRILIALTRFDALGNIAARLPIGLTVRETAALAGALGARRALMLDGGISAQLLLRGPGGLLRWPGLRRVPLALIAVRRRPRWCREVLGDRERQQGAGLVDAADRRGQWRQK